MAEVGSAFVSIVPSFQGFGRNLARGLNGAAGSVGDGAGRTAGSRFSRAFSGATAAIGKAAFAGVAAAGAGITGALGWGLKVASENEQAAISFETMLGSAEKAGAFLKDLQSFAAKTPFEFPELQTAASSLISAGIEASKVVPIMTTLGDVTSGMGTGSEGVKRATVALQQMNAAGRITGEDLNQLRDAGIPVYDLLAAATGKSKEAVAELASKGKLGREELTQLMGALESGAGLERFSGLMEKQSASLSGMVSTFKDTLGQGLANAIAPALPSIKAGIGTVSGLLGTFFENLPSMIENVKTFLAPIIDSFRTVFPAAINVVRPYLDDIFAGLLAALPIVQAALAALGDVFTGVFSFIANNRTLVESLAGAVLAGVVAFKLWTGAIKLWSAITKAAAAVQAAFNLVMAANPIMLVVIAIAALVAGLVIAYQRSETFRNIVNGVFAAVKGFVIGAISAVKNFVVGAWNFMVAAVKAYVNMYATVIRVAFAVAKAVITAALNAAKAVVSAVWKAIVSAVTAGVNGVKRVIAGISAIVGVIRNAFNAAVSAITGFVGRAASGARSIITGIVNALRNGVSTMAGIGRDIVQGVINGITGAAGRVASAARKIVDNIAGPVKKLLGIGSPSKLFRQYGEWTGEGLVLGLEDRARAVERAAADLAGRVSGVSMPSLAAVDVAAGTTARVGVPALSGGVSPVAAGAPSFRVFIGDRELTDIVRVETERANESTARALAFGRRI